MFQKNTLCERVWSKGIDMDTYFASPERTTEKDLLTEIDCVNQSPVMSGLLHAISGLLAVLDENRQIVALNDSFMKMLGVDDPSAALGFRPGEVLNCEHAEEEPAGCGTTPYCASCGAAIAIVSSLGQDKPVERCCALTANRGGHQLDMALLVRSQPITLSGKRFLLLFLQDISKQQQRAALERMFFHDFNNIMGMLMGNCELLLEEGPSKYARDIHKAALRLHKQVCIQRTLANQGTLNYQALWHKTTAGEILEELKAFFANHPVSRGRHLAVSSVVWDMPITTDISLMLRVLCNMVINAFEATDSGGTVRVWAEHQDEKLSFCVWNEQAIPPDTARRVFQRNYSTKQQDGRGIGTYSMKLFGETILGGQVGFTTSPKAGTTFRFDHPL